MKQMAHDEEKETHPARKEVAERETETPACSRKIRSNEKERHRGNPRRAPAAMKPRFLPAELFRMLFPLRPETQGWKVEILESSPSSIGRPQGSRPPRSKDKRFYYFQTEI